MRFTVRSDTPSFSAAWAFCHIQVVTQQQGVALLVVQVVHQGRAQTLGRVARRQNVGRIRAVVGQRRRAQGRLIVIDGHRRARPPLGAQVVAAQVARRGVQIGHHRLGVDLVHVAPGGKVRLLQDILGLSEAHFARDGKAQNGRRFVVQRVEGIGVPRLGPQRQCGEFVI